MNVGDTPEFSIPRAHVAQLGIAKRVIGEDKFQREIAFVCGVDVAYTDDWAFSVAVTLDYATLSILEIQSAHQKVKFPYIPTLLAFRELPAAVSCIRKLKLKPDVFLVDGHGKAHPYGCGLASHLGVVLGMTTIGVAKRKLIGEVKQLDGNVFLVYEGKVVGAQVTTLENAKPVYVSVGHLVSLETAVKIVKHCSPAVRIPEPIRLAHTIASRERKAKIALLH